MRSARIAAIALRATTLAHARTLTRSVRTIWSRLASFRPEDGGALSRLVTRGLARREPNGGTSRGANGNEVVGNAMVRRTLDPAATQG